MTRRNSRAKSSSSVSYMTLDRVYRCLPLFFIVMSALNVWFLYSYVRADRERVEVDRAETLSSVSNVYSFVMNSLSNQIQEVRFHNSIMLRPVFTSSTNLSAIVSQSLPPSNVVSVVQSSISPERLSCWYSKLHGRPAVSFGGTHSYGVGDDFGFGPIERVTRLFVFCDGVRYRLSEPPAPSVPSSLPRSEQSFIVSNSKPVNEGLIENVRFP